MKKIILLILTLITFVGYSQQKKKNHLEEADLKGKVKSIKITQYESLEMTKKDTILNSRQFILYNEQGNKIEENNYDAYGKLYNKSTYIYDDNARLIEKNWLSSQNGNLILIDKHRYEYDKNGNKTKYNSYDSNGNNYGTIVYNHDSNGNKIEEIRYNSDGSIGRKLTYQYNQKQHLTEEIRYVPKENLSLKIIYKYDNQGHLIEAFFYSSRGKLENKQTHKYDKKGNLTQTNTYDSSGNLYARQTFKYDNKENKIEENKFGKDSKYDKKSIFKYNTKGDLTEKIHISKEGFYSKWTYKYDSHGNWIEEIFYDDNLFVAMTKREIAYYE
ncbi:RHS repeat domain-containing protein [Capnocytophaga canimorsus]|uniref:RHS repeat domain-containing protein n=1 Tax=Capnocytophaga canimorsus TaxID=28188 RepID=UPI0037D52565